jgi:hypothetical protein
VLIAQAQRLNDKNIFDIKSHEKARNLTKLNMALRCQSKPCRLWMDPHVDMAKLEIPGGTRQHAACDLRLAAQATGT